jgi:hypothetical protein
LVNPPEAYAFSFSTPNGTPPVAAVGTPLDRVQAPLAKQLERFAYQTEVLHLSEYANRFSLPTRPPDKSAGEAARIKCHDEPRERGTA